MVPELKARIEATIPRLAGRTEGAADLAELSRQGAWPQHTPFAHVVPAGLQGLGATAAAGSFVQMYRELVSVVLTLRTYDLTSGDDVPELHELIDAVLRAVAGWLSWISLSGVFPAGDAMLHGGELLRRDAHWVCNKKPRPESRGRGA